MPSPNFFGHTLKDRRKAKWLSKMCNIYSDIALGQNQTNFPDSDFRVQIQRSDIRIPDSELDKQRNGHLMEFYIFGLHSN